MKTSNLLIDSYAWVEFFLGSSKGEKVRNYLDHVEEASTPLVVVAELSAKYAGLSATSWRERLEFIQSKTEILPLTLEIVSEAGRLRQKMREERARFGLVDAIIYETAKTYDLSVLSGDPHFKGLPHVVFLD